MVERVEEGELGLEFIEVSNTGRALHLGLTTTNHIPFILALSSNNYLSFTLVLLFLLG
jgi:hypothetical protein